MTPNRVVIGAIIGSIIGCILLFAVVLIIYYYWCYILYSDTSLDDDRALGVHFSNAKGSRIVKLLNRLRSRKVDEDLEGKIDIDKPPTSVTNCDTNFSSSAASRLALRSVALQTSSNISSGICKGNVKDISIIPCNKDDAESSLLEYKDAIERFESFSDELIVNDKKQAPTVKQLKSTQGISSVMHKMDDLESTNFNTLMSGPSSEQSYISDQFDSFARTLMIQNLLDNSKHSTKKLLIREVDDPFLENNISIGGIAVVVKSFLASNQFEFKLLHPGDLLRIVRFYVNDTTLLNPHKSNKHSIEPSTDISDFEKHFDSDKIPKSEIHKTDSDYEFIYCTGILLNTYLEFNNKTCDFSLRFKKGTNQDSEAEYLKDFPLKIVSLETTVLKSLANSAVQSGALET